MSDSKFYPGQVVRDDDMNHFIIDKVPEDFRLHALGLHEVTPKKGGPAEYRWTSRPISPDFVVPCKCYVREAMDTWSPDERDAFNARLVEVRDLWGRIKADEPDKLSMADHMLHFTTQHDRNMDEVNRQILKLKVKYDDLQISSGQIFMFVMILSALMVFVLGVVMFKYAQSLEASIAATQGHVSRIVSVLKEL